MPYDLDFKRDSSQPARSRRPARDRAVKRCRMVIGVGALVAFGCGGGSTEPDPDPLAPLSIIARPPVSDTITATPVQGIVAQVGDGMGRALAGAIVQFRGLPGPGSAPQTTMLVREISSPTYKDFVAVTTDSRGQAVAQVQFGSVAGAGQVEIAVAALGLADTLDFTISPGNLAQILAAPRDTAMHPGSLVALQATTKDRLNNARQDPVTWQGVSTPAGAASVSSTGIVSATAPSRVRLIASSGTARDTVFVSAVPPGSYLAVQDFSAALILSDLDGSGRTVFRAGPLSPYFEPAWSPAGTEVALVSFSDASRIEFMTLNGISSDISWSPATTGAAYWPAYSRDGQFLYFTGVRFGDPTGIHRIRRDGTGLQTLVTCACYRPSLSPTGQFMTFHAVSQAFDVAVRVWDILAQSFVGVEVAGRFPEYSPTYNGIAFHENQTGRIQLMDQDGTNRHYLTPAGRQYRDDQQIAWSGDGAWVLARSVFGLDLIQVTTGLVLPLPGTVSLFHPAMKP